MYVVLGFRGLLLQTLVSDTLSFVKDTLRFGTAGSVCAFREDMRDSEASWDARRE